MSKKLIIPEKCQNCAEEECDAMLDEMPCCSYVPNHATALKELEEYKKLYNELIFEVCNKWPGETRHETAKRYIRERESSHQSNHGEAKVADDN